MKTQLLSASLILLALPATATVSIEFQLGGLSVPAGSVGVLVADTGADGFTNPGSSPGTVLAPGVTGSLFGANDVIIAAFQPEALAGWGSQTGFAELLAAIDYQALGVSAGQNLVFHLFPDQTLGGTVRQGEPHISYRTEVAGDFTPSSTMGFQLPPDGGAHVLAALATGQGGNADLAGIDLAPLPYANGAGQLGRTLGPTGRHTLFFNLAQTSFLTLEGLGAAGFEGELFGPNGQRVAQTVSGRLEFYNNLAPGLYTLVLFRSAGATGNLNYTLAFANTDTRQVLPDVTVGPTLTTQRGRNVYNGHTSQISILLSRGANPVGGFATVANRGKRPNALALRATPGNTRFGVMYLVNGRNVSTALRLGTYRSPVLESTKAAVNIRVNVTPVKRLLVRRVGTRNVVTRASYVTAIRATSTVGPTKFDSARLQVNTL